MDVESLRADTPAAARGVYLNHASASLMPRPVIEAVRSHFALEAEAGANVSRAAAGEALEGVYDSVARLVGAGADEIALTGSNTRAWQLAFYGLALGEGDRVLTARAEYGANYVGLLQQARRTGCRIEVIPDDASGACDPAALEAMIDARVKLIAVTWIPTNGGLVNPAAAIGRVANAHGIPYLLDACQAVGQMPVDVKTLGCDFLTATGRKWLRGPRGTGFLYVRRAMLGKTEPAVIDDTGARWTAPDRYALRDDARRYEVFECAPALRLGLGAAADYARGLGLETIRERVRGHAQTLRQALEQMPGITVRDLGAERAGLVTFSHESVDASAIVGGLKEKGFEVKAVPRAGALLDSTARDLPELVRVSAHYINTEAEIAAVLDVLKAATDGRK